MKVLLLDIKARANKKCINKDLAGGMGTGTWVGYSFLARVFEYVKKTNVILPVLATAYLAAIFKRAGWEVKVLEIKEYITVVENVDLVLIASSIVDCYHELEIAQKIKQQGVFVGVYGTFASVLPEFFLPYVDLVIKGEPEAGVLKILAEPTLPRGIVEVGLVDNLDGLPFPDWDQFPVGKYSYSPALNKKPVLPMLASRGCPYSCSFYCAYPINYGKQWRPRSIQNVIAEMKCLKEKYKVKAIDFRDPTFTFDRQRSLAFANELIKQELRIIWSCETRLDRLDRELIKVMYQAGLRNLNVGIESASAEILQNSKRIPIADKQQYNIIDYCHELGITIAAFYILGLENDTEESVNNTIRHAKKLNTMVAQFSLSTPYLGTCFYEKLKMENRITDLNWENYDEYTPVFRHNFLRPEKLLALKEKAFVDYYFRPRYLFRHLPKYLFQKFLWPF